MRFIEFLVEYDSYDQYWIDDETEKTKKHTAATAKGLSRGGEEAYRWAIREFLQFIEMAHGHRAMDLKQEFIHLRQRFIQAHKNENWDLAATTLHDAFNSFENMTAQKKTYASSPSDIMFAGYGMNG